MAYGQALRAAGVFVAGDLRHGSIKRVASAVGEGAMAIALIRRYLDLGKDRHDRDHTLGHLVGLFRQVLPE